MSHGSLRGPDLVNLDTSLFKKIRISERWNLQFRVEDFNLLNHPGFSYPNPIVFSGSDYSSSVGQITGTATTSRQLQLAPNLAF